MKDMRHLISLIESDDGDLKLWHGTSESADDMRRSGLIGSRLGAVFLTDNPQLALEYAETDQDRTGNDTITLVSVLVRDLDQAKLHGDSDHGDYEDWKASLQDCDQCMYFGSIPADVLTVEEY
jgi:hypothetical protein